MVPCLHDVPRRLGSFLLFCFILLGASWSQRSCSALGFPYSSKQSEGASSEDSRVIPPYQESRLFQSHWKTSVCVLVTRGYVAAGRHWFLAEHAATLCDALRMKGRVDVEGTLPGPSVFLPLVCCPASCSAEAPLPTLGH